MPIAYLKSHIPFLRWIILGQGLIIIVLVIFFIFRGKEAPVDTKAGMDINELAWEASFKERSLPVPAQGPREGYWGKKMKDPTYDSELGWRLTEQNALPYLSVDARGLQHKKGTTEKPVKILILGASVAFGAYASDEEHVYFSALQKVLLERGQDVEITVAAAGAWKSEQSLAALMKYYDDVNPDAILYINGLNSLTIGSNAETRYGEEVKTENGAEWDILYHERDYEERAKKYLENMIKAKKFAAEKNRPILFVLQPALFEKKNMSKIESALSSRYVTSLGPLSSLSTSYGKMRKEMENMTQEENAHFLDLSRAFDDETATTFTDMWHFADPGHRIVGEKLADFVEPIIRNVYSTK